MVAAISATVAIVLTILMPFAALADGRWVYEWSLSAKIAASRNMAADCQKVVPLHYVELYAQDPRDGWTISCGGSNPLYVHFIGRRIGQPLPNLKLYFGWTHGSHAFDHTETTFDAVGIKGRFEWGRQD